MSVVARCGIERMRLGLGALMTRCNEGSVVNMRITGAAIGRLGDRQCTGSDLGSASYLERNTRRYLRSLR